MKPVSQRLLLRAPARRTRGSPATRFEQRRSVPKADFQQFGIVQWLSGSWVIPPRIIGTWAFMVGTQHVEEDCRRSD